MGVDSSGPGGYIELMLPALDWVNSHLEALGSVEWVYDHRPAQYLVNMPRNLAKSPPPPKVSPYARRVTPSSAQSRIVPASRNSSASSRVPLVPRTPMTSNVVEATPPRRPRSMVVIDTTEDDGEASMVRTSRHWSDVYLYFDEPQVSLDEMKAETSRSYPCLHFPVVLSVAGRPNSNLHKHRRKCAGLPLAWYNHEPGSIAPEQDPIVASERKKEQRTMLVGAVISKNLPFLIFEGALMQKALRLIAPSFQWPGRMAVKSDSEALFYDLERKLLDEVAAVPGSISTATDCWTSADFSHTYMAINGFFFNSEGKFCRRLLAFKKLEGKHTGDNLAKVYWKALEHVGALRNHYAITGDNASSNRAMAKILGDHYATIGIHWPFDSRFHGCMCHVINLVAKDFLDGMGQLTDEDVAAFETSGLAESRASFEPDELPCTGDYNVSVCDSLPEAPEPNSQASLEVHGPTQTQDEDLDLSQMTCDDIVPEDSHVDESPTVLLAARKKKSTIVTRIRALDTHIRKSPQELEAFIKIRDSVKDPQLLPLSCPATRWNYFYYVVQRTLNLRKSLELYTSDPKRAHLTISKSDWSTIEYMQPVLEMFKTATQIFQSNDTTKQLVLPVLWALQAVLKKHQAVPGAWGRAAKRAEDKLVKYLTREEGNQQTLVATLLDPFQRDSIFRNHVAVEVQAKCALQDEYELWKPSPTESGPESPPPAPVASKRSTHKKKIHEIYSLLGTSHMEPSTSPGHDLDEVSRYFQRLDPVLANESIGEFWVRMSKPGGLQVLAQIALQHLTIAAAGASVERVFSISGNIAVPSRGRLDPDTICHLVLVQHWLANWEATVNVEEVA